jgi:hypothetical protein
VRSPLATLRSLVRRYERELVCGRCRAVLAWVRLRPVALMHVRDTTGAEVTPLGCRSALGIAERRLGQARAAGAAGRPQALDEYAGIAACEREMAYLRREAGEVMYEFRCRACRARYVRSLPDLAAAVRRAGGSRVELR